MLNDIEQQASTEKGLKLFFSFVRLIVSNFCAKSAITI